MIAEAAYFRAAASSRAIPYATGSAERDIAILLSEANGKTGTCRGHRSAIPAPGRRPGNPRAEAPIFAGAAR